jgi:hypothetical protein
MIEYFDSLRKSSADTKRHYDFSNFNNLDVSSIEVSQNIQLSI